MKNLVLALLILLPTFASADDAVPLAVSTGYYSRVDVQGILTPLILRRSSVFFFQTVDRLDQDTNAMSKVIHGIFGKTGEITCDLQGDCDWSMKHRDGTAKLSILQNEDLSLTLYNSKDKLISTLTFHFLGRDKDLVAAALQLKEKKKAVHTRYLAHRGSAYIPEVDDDAIWPANTIPAFGAALDAGFAGFELDAHLSKDDVFFVSHDNDLSVSSDCKGLITGSTVSQVEPCTIVRSGLIPESGFGAHAALKTFPISTLKKVLDTYLADPRLHALTIDLKPGDEKRQTEILHALLASYPIVLMEKIIVLTRSETVAVGLEDLEKDAPDMTVAHEGDDGWEPLDAARNPKTANALEGAPYDAVSISLGLGLGLSGWGHGVFPTLGVIWNVIASLPKALFTWHLDIGDVRWSHRNIKYFKSFLMSAHEKDLHVIGWTINTLDKILKIREVAPNLDYILTDLPFDEIARLEARELTKEY